jgi:HAD superfamily hydrolase (TIGR01549 family)
VYKSGTAQSPDEVVAYWWKKFKIKTDQSFGANYRTQYELVMETFEEMLKHFNSNENVKELCDMMILQWSKPNIYEDTMTFLDQMNLPIYFVTNSDNSSIHQAIDYHQMKPTGIITSEEAKCSKPRKEIFLYALEKAGLQASEVIHTGDSLSGDIQGPRSAGIEAILMNREKKEVPSDITFVHNLEELLTLLKTKL